MVILRCNILLNWPYALFPCMCLVMGQKSGSDNRLSLMSAMNELITNSEDRRKNKQLCALIIVFI